MWEVPVANFTALGNTESSAPEELQVELFPTAPSVDQRSVGTADGREESTDLTEAVGGVFPCCSDAQTAIVQASPPPSPHGAPTTEPGSWWPHFCRHDQPAVIPAPSLPTIASSPVLAPPVQLPPPLPAVTARPSQRRTLAPGHTTSVHLPRIPLPVPVLPAEIRLNPLVAHVLPARIAFHPDQQGGHFTVATGSNTQPPTQPSGFRILRPQW
eukprot:GHVT01015744.1.p1 GENE.GHVT01015744.1~~GHVT01015744.1.p1  ORF type:complete len:213 (-),score=19.25 GHVT01015744.1:909-1547(-)